MGEKKYNNIKIAENIYFYEDLHGVIIDGNKVELKGHEYDLLYCLVSNKGNIVYPSDILRNVWGGGYVDYYDRDLIKSPLKLLRKHLGDQDKKIIITEKGIGYRLGMYMEYKDSPPIALTNRIVPNVTNDSVIMRENELNQIINLLLHDKKKAIMLSGFGGVGKTSLARLIYSNIKDRYDSTGWIEYHKNLKSSILECFNFDVFPPDCSNRNLNGKWACISDLMNNTRERKLLVIDNVDVDYENDQDPLSDRTLNDISGWTNTDIIITTRLPKIGYYLPIRINNLGNEKHIEKCIKLFYHYYSNGRSKSDYNNTTVKKLIELAGYNTMVIELLAKSCIYEESIESYYTKLTDIGFSYPSLDVMTMHDDCSKDTKEQLANLFSLRKRSDIEKSIVVAFRLLPEGESISRYELEKWMGFTIKDIDRLVKEGWINYNDAFSIHPLIRHSISLDKAALSEYNEEQENSHFHSLSITSMIRNKSFFDNSDDFNIGLRKLNFADYLSYPYDHLYLEDCIYIADYARKLGKRDISLKYYKMGYDFVSLNNTESYTNKAHISDDYYIWKSTYYYGYLLSYTKKGMEKAENILNEALEIAIRLNTNNERSIMMLAASQDHLGYTIFNNDQNGIHRLLDAKTHLDKAIEYRTSLCTRDKDNIRYFHDLAWSQDNMGCLLTKISDIIDSNDNTANANQLSINYRKKAEEYLTAALYTRKKIALLTFMKGDRNSSSEVAWTCCNLAVCVSYDSSRLNEALRLFRRSVAIYKNIEKNAPGLEMSSFARTLTAQAKVSVKMNNKDEAIRLYNSALELNKKLEANNPGVYSGEIDYIINELHALSNSVNVKINL